VRSLPLALFLYARRGRFSKSVRREEVRILACYKVGQIKIPKSGSVRAANGDIYLLLILCNDMKALNYRSKDSEIIPISNSLFVSNDVKGDDASLSLICKSNFLGHEINVYGSSESPLFLAKDVAEWIEHSDVSTMVRTVDEDEKLTQTLFVSGQRRECNFLTEDGLYEVLMQSRKPIAKDFKKGIKGILKTIRKHGIYATDNVIDQILNNPDFGIELLTKLKEERSARIEAEKQVAVLTHVNKTYTCTEVAKELGLKSAIELNNRLKELGVQYKVNQTWVPYTKYATLGWFDIKQEVADNGHIIYHRKITGIGRQGIINLLV
jgi:prophage antirepressor-like protein